jgi:hypothetical protein
MLVEQRVYSLTPGGTLEYVKVYEELGRRVQERILGRLLGYYTREIGELNQLVYFWEFDSMDERARRRAELAANDEFKAFRAKVRHLLLKQENSILIPA